MKIRLLRKYIRESLGREVMLSPERLRSRSTGGEPQRELTAIKTIDKTRLSDEEIIEELIIAAGPDTYIRFEKNYGNLEFPPLKVSPKIKYQTPHGIYGYPLNQVNVENLINSGAPTSSNFATNYDFFHVYRLDKSRTVNVARGDNDLKQVIGRYTTEKKVIDDIAECIRIVSNLFKKNKNKNKTIEIPMPTSSSQEFPISQFKQDIAALSKSKKSSYLELSDIFKKYKDFIVKTSEKSNTSKNLIEIFKQEIAEAIFEYKKVSVSKRERNTNSTKQFMLFKILKASIEYIAEAFSDSQGTKRGQYYSLLLKAIGITGITDLGTSTIHDNEPSQAVSFDFSGNTIDPVGTYKNIFKTENNKELKQKFNQILEDLIKNNIVNWNATFVRERSNYDYKNISLKSFNIILKDKASKDEDPASFIVNVALKNKNSDVLENIFNMTKSLSGNLGLNRMGLLNTMTSNKNLPARISNDLYQVFIKPNINLSNKAIKEATGNGHPYFISSFVKSPTLSKEAKLDIVDKTKKAKIFIKPFILQQLLMSKYLEREVVEDIIEKFGFDESGIGSNSKAPISDYMLKKIIEQHDLMSKVTVKGFSASEKNEVIEKLCRVLSNPHVKDGEIKYILSVLSPALKEIANLKIDPDNMPDYFYEICYNITDEGNVTADHLSAANLTLEEEIKILKALTYCLWYSDEETYLDIDEESFSITPYDEFDMLKLGIPYINSAPPGKSIKKAFNRAYNYFVNAK